MCISSFFLQERILQLILLTLCNFVCVYVLTVPGAVPSQSLRATPFEDRILLYWKEPAEPNGVIIQYEVLLAEAEGVVIAVGARLSLRSVGKMYQPGFCLCPTSDQLQWCAVI